MYMGKIVAAKAPASSAPLRRAVGIPVLLLSALVMLPWLAGYAAYATLMLGLRGVAKAPRAMLGAVDYAGTVALGR